MKKVLFYPFFTVFFLCTTSPCMSPTEKIIEKVTKFQATTSKKKPYHQLKDFLCVKKYGPEEVEKIACELELAYEKRKDERSIGEWHDYVPYCISRCFVCLLQNSLNPAIFKDWKSVASAIAMYCTQKSCDLTADEVQNYYDIRRAPDGLTGGYFAYCKKAAQEKFVKNGIVLDEKKELLDKFRAFAELHTDSRMKIILSQKLLLSKN